jgi:hypothetical protein
LRDPSANTTLRAQRLFQLSRDQIDPGKAEGVITGDGEVELVETVAIEVRDKRAMERKMVVQAFRKVFKPTTVPEKYYPCLQD